MLRASAEHLGTPFELRGVIDDDVDPLVEAGVELRAFTTALVGRVGDLDAARLTLLGAVGRPAAVRAAAVAGNFEMMNRVVDGTGVPVSRDLWRMADSLGVERPA